MRFAGFRIRNPKQQMPNQRAESGYVPDFTAPVSVQGTSPVMLNMRDVNAASMAFTAMPEMGKSPFVMPEWNEAQFRA
jgi:hypothetical protein